MSSTLKAVVRHRTFIALVTLAVVWGGFSLYEVWAAPGKLDPALRQAMTEEKAVGRIALQFDFQPEEYHINTLQNYGIVAGVEGQTIYMVQVPTPVIQELSELYWVRSIRLANR